MPTWSGCLPEKEDNNMLKIEVKRMTVDTCKISDKDEKKVMDCLMTTLSLIHGMRGFHGLNTKKERQHRY